MNPLLALKNGHAEKPFSDNARLSVAEFSNGLFDKTSAKVVLFLGNAMDAFGIIVLFGEWGKVLLLRFKQKTSPLIVRAFEMRPRYVIFDIINTCYMTYTLEIKKDYALRIIKELQKVDAVKLRKVSKSKKAKESEEDIALIEAMKDADFSDTVSEETVMKKLKVK